MVAWLRRYWWHLRAPRAPVRRAAFYLARGELPPPAHPAEGCPLVLVRPILGADPPLLLGGAPLAAVLCLCVGLLLIIL